MAGSFFVSAEYLAFNRDNDGLRDRPLQHLLQPRAGCGRARVLEGPARPRACRARWCWPRSCSRRSSRASRRRSSATTATRKEVDTVVDFYRGLLGALPDDGGFNFWLGQFRTAQCQGGAAVNAQVETISSAFANSAQYANRGRTNAQYVGDLYNAFLRRGGGPGRACSSGSTRSPAGRRRASRCARPSWRARSSRRASPPSSRRGACSSPKGDCGGRP